GLGNRPRKTVQEKTGVCIRLAEPFGHDTNDDLIRNQFAAVQILLGLFPQGRPVFNRRPEDIARGDMGDGEIHSQLLGLRTLAGPGGPQKNKVGPFHQQHSYFKKPSYCRISSWASICFIVSIATPTTIKSPVPPKPTGILVRPLMR